MFKFADDTTLVVPADSNVDLNQEFHHVKDCAVVNKMILNLIKTEEIVLALNIFLHEPLSVVSSKLHVLNCWVGL